jgi:serine/threonine protein kinase
MNLVGIILNSRYEIGDKIADGGMCSVYRGTDLVQGFPIAVKVISQAAVSYRIEDQVWFRTEVEAVSRLDHPNIVKIYDNGHSKIPGHSPFHYIVMELVEGTSLHDLLKKGACYTPQQSTGIAMDICSTGHMGYILNRAHRLHFFQVSNNPFPL